MNNLIVKQQILEKYADDRYIDAAKVGVTVDNGVVTLTGRVASMGIAARAEALACEVLGVKAVALELTTDDQPVSQHLDEDIAASILNKFKNETLIPEDQLTLHVQDARVVVKGDVYWLYQKNAVSVVLQNVSGIRETLNQINIIDEVSDQDLETQISASLSKIPATTANALSVNCNSGVVTLVGTIDPNVERASLIHAVRSVPGVRHVYDQLVVG